MQLSNVAWCISKGCVWLWLTSFPKHIAGVKLPKLVLLLLKIGLLQGHNLLPFLFGQRWQNKVIGLPNVILPFFFI